MPNEYDYTDIKLHGRFTADGEEFRVYTELNGVEVWLLNLDVPSQRERFNEARAAATPPETGGTSQ